MRAIFGSRRDFLTRVGQAGGYGAAFAAMQALELNETWVSAATLPDLAPNAGKATKVAILGGGIAGLVSAYELGKAGFECTVLEARERPGGRNLTIRDGTSIEFTDGVKQTARWGPDSYFNAGPARLPSIHKTMLGYCKELDVKLEVEVNSSRSSLLVSDRAFDGKPVEQRQAVNDTRGHVAELLAKCINQNALDQEFSAEDRERMLGFLRTYGDLKDDFVYRGSPRAGVSRMPGSGPVTEELREPLAMHPLLDANFWGGMMFEETLDMQATMFQPVGGMDRIPHAFAKKLGRVVQYRATVREIRKTANGVRISYTQGGNEKSVDADYCICALPVTILKTIPNDFSPRIRTAIETTTYADAYKIAWESKRFWETERNIYGGISFLSTGPINLVWYPSAKLFSETGVLVSGYAQEHGSEFGALPTMDAKIAASRAAVERLHPEFGKQLTNPMYMYWAKIPFNLGSWVGRGHEYYDGAYKEFTEPDDRFYFAGDHCSRVGAWQEGAALAAHRAIQMIAERMQSEKLTQQKKRLAAA
jgi:monoamine oxidase